MGQVVLDQIFNRSHLGEKIDGSLGLPAPEPLGEGGLDLHYFLLGDDAFCLDAMDGETLQQKTTHKGRENSKLQDLQRQEGG